MNGATVADSLTVTREALTASTTSKTLSFSNSTSGTLIGGLGGQWHLRAFYSSNYEAPDPISNLVDVKITASFRVLYFNSDAITLWLSEDTTSNYTASIVQAMTVPLNSSTNGSMIEYMREASEVVFEYPNFINTNYYDKDIFTSSIEGGSYKASTEILVDEINLTHTTSAPYSASFNQALPNLPADQSIELKFTADFESYWTTYLNSFNFNNTPFITASIRNKNTKVVTGSLSFDIQQGQYPNEYQRTLKYENNTGGALSDLEFYYQVNVPKADKGSGNPKVNLKNISINYREPGVTYNKSRVLSSQKLLDTLFIDIAPDLEVYSGSLDYFELSSDFYKVGFITGEDELFKFNDYAATEGSIDSLRRSKLRLKVEDKTYSATRGKFKNFLVPSNYEIISSSIVNGVEGLDKRLFAELQDSNYSLTSWRNSRYDGSLTNNRRRGVRILGLEPSLTFDNFNAFSFPLSASNDEIRGFYSTFEDSGGSEKGDTVVYYNKYESKQLGDVLLELTNVTSSINASIPASSFTTVTGTGYSFNITGSISSYEYSGSIEELVDGGSVELDFNLAYTFLTDSEISSSIYLPDLELIDGVKNTVISSSNLSFSDGTFVSADSQTDTYSYNVTFRTDVVTSNAILKFEGSSLPDPDAVPNGNINMSINTIKKSNFIPVNNPNSGIVAETSELKTFFYKEVLPTPSNPNGYDALTQRKFYRLDTGQIYSTNDLGIVTNIE